MAVRVRRWQSERGAELIEFAIVAPILIFLIAGIFDFGMMFRTFEAVTNAAREGARVGVLPGYTDPDVVVRVDDYLVAAGLDPASSLTTPSNGSVTTAAGTFTTKVVLVEYTYQFVVLGPIAGFFGGSFGSIPLRARAEMRAEVQGGGP